MFEGKLIRLRPFELDDSDAVFEYLNHPGLTGRRYIPWEYPNDRPLARSQIDGLVHDLMTARKESTLAVTLADSGEVVGHATMNWDWDPHCPFVAVVIAPSHQRQGCGGEAADLVLRYLFDQTVAHVAQTWVDNWNESGLALARQLGFHESGAMRRAGVHAGQFVNAIAFDLLRREWKQLQEMAHGAGR